MDKSDVSSKCMSFVVKQTNKAIYDFDSCLTLCVTKGPVKSTPVSVNGGEGVFFIRECKHTRWMSCKISMASRLFLGITIWLRWSSARSLVCVSLPPALMTPSLTKGYSRRRGFFFATDSPLINAFSSSMKNLNCSFVLVSEWSCVYS